MPPGPYASFLPFLLIYMPILSSVAPLISLETISHKFNNIPVNNTSSFASLFPYHKCLETLKPGSTLLSELSTAIENHKA
jgi:hypothetical protein